MRRNPVILSIFLSMGIIVPVLYFGIQLIGAMFYPDYNFLSNVASDLGSPTSRFPELFNGGAILSGVAGIGAAFGFWLALPRLGVNHWLASVLGLTIVALALGNLWAGLYPLPDPRHAQNPFAPGLLLAPVICLLALWSQPDSRWLKVYLVGSCLALLALTLVFSGAVNLSTQGFQGLLQRLLAASTILPVGIVAWFSLRRLARAAASTQLNL